MLFIVATFFILICYFRIFIYFEEGEIKAELELTAFFF